MTSFEEITIQAVKGDPTYGYNGRIREIREAEYSHLGGTSILDAISNYLDTMYLDHAGATPYPVSIVQEHCHDLTTNLLSNPHSHSPSSMCTDKRIASVRLRLLQMFNADP